MTVNANFKLLKREENKRTKKGTNCLQAENEVHLKVFWIKIWGYGSE